MAGFNKRAIVLLGWLLTAALPLQAAGLDDFQLSRAIPADAVVVIQSRTHDGMTFLKQQYQRVMDEILAQNFGSDLRRLMRQAAEQSGEDLAQFDEQWQRFNDLLATVDWSMLLDGESAYAMKLVFPTGLDAVALLEPSTAKGRDSFDGLVGMLEALVALAPAGELNHATEGSGDSVAHRVTFANSPVPFMLLLAREKGVILFGIGGGMPEQSLEMLRGKKGQTLAATERFQAAFKALPPPRDALTYVEMSRLMNQCRDMVNKAVEQMTPPGQDATQTAAEQMKALPGKLIDLFDINDVIASVTTTDGMKTTMDTVQTFRSGAADRPLYKVLYGNGPLEQPMKFVPKSASTFTATSGVNLQALYTAMLDFVRKEVPDGELYLEQWEQIKLTMPIDLEQDLLSWIGGGMTMFSVAGAGPYASGDTILIFNVRDEARAREVVDRGLATLQVMLEAQQGGVVDAKIEGATGFKSINMPLLAMMPIGLPVIGLAEGNLFIGIGPTAAKSISAALRTASGAEENFSKNERFLKEGLTPEGQVTSLSYSDLSTFGKDLADGLQMASGMMTLMGGPNVSKDPGTMTLLRVMQKAGNVLRKLDFLLSTSSFASMADGKIVTRSVTHYQEPPRPKVSGGEDDATGAGQ